MAISQHEQILHEKSEELISQHRSEFEDMWNQFEEELEKKMHEVEMQWNDEK